MKVIYVSHPYGGKKENENSADRITKILADTFPNVTFISPIHAIRREYSKTPYIEGLKYTLEILNRSDGIFMSPEWKGSNGCQIERSLAKHKGMPIFYTFLQLALWTALRGET